MSPQRFEMIFVDRGWRGVVLAGAFLALGCPGLGDSDPPSLIDEVPEMPTWSDVKPVLDLYCNECHSVPSTQSAPSYLRLDSCEDQDGVQGAKSQAMRIDARSGTGDTMPPSSFAYQPTENERILLKRWVTQGATCSESDAMTQTEPDP